MEKEFYTTFEVAKMCHVSPGSVVRWINEGKLVTAQTAGGHNRIQAKDIVRFLKGLRMPIPEALQGKENGKLKILIVDDEASVRKFIWAALNMHFKDILVEEAEDGFAAGAKISRFSPDLILLDLRLPGMDGFRVCQFIRTDLGMKRVRIIAITGFNEEETRKKILELGANDYLVKPFNAEKLKEHVEIQMKILKELKDKPSGLKSV